MHDRHNLKHSFLDEWPLERVRNMSLEEYTNLNKQDSFCYWLEHTTEKLGSIRGGSSYKFGIFKRSNTDREITKDQYRTDGTYAWYKKYEDSDSAEYAFETVRDIIVRIIEAAKRDELSIIDELDLGESTKWKIAFLYSDDHVINIFNRSSLNGVAMEKGLSNPEKKPTSEIHRYLMNQKPEDVPYFEYTDELWEIMHREQDQESEVMDMEETEDASSGDLPNIVDIGLNTILFGPPGTGKTYQLRNRYAPSFTIDQKLRSQEEFELDMIEPLTWWETTGLALLETGETTVPELRTHRFIRTKENISNVKNVNATLWSTLQSHSSPDFDNVNISNRTEPFIFRKLERSVWTVLEEEIDQKLPHLKETLSRIKQYSPESVRQQNFVFTTFHQSFTYEDFVEGIKPVMDEVDADSESGEIQYAIKKGIFYKAVDDACQLAGFKGLKECLESTPVRQRAQFDQAPPYALFIDEINRGNIAAIMGELITLIEDDKRISGDHELIVKLPYSKEQFGVPPNLHIIGTMNTADRSVEALDTALRRRFQFREVPPDPSLISQLGDQNGIISVDDTDIRLDELLRTINRRIEKILDKDHLIGHSYFLRVKDWKDLRDIFRQNIIPLLEEYFYGDKGKIQLVLGKGFIEKVEDQSSDLFPETDYDDQDLFAERFVWRIRDEWKTDEAAFAEAIRQLNIHSSE